jgi:hypothetical protein
MWSIPLLHCDTQIAKNQVQVTTFNDLPSVDLIWIPVFHSSRKTINSGSQGAKFVAAKILLHHWKQMVIARWQVPDIIAAICVIELWNYVPLNLILWLTPIYFMHCLISQQCTKFHLDHLVVRSNELWKYIYLDICTFHKPERIFVGGCKTTCKSLL